MCKIQVSMTSKDLIWATPQYRFLRAEPPLWGITPLLIPTKFVLKVGVSLSTIEENSKHSSVASFTWHSSNSTSGRDKQAYENVGIYQSLVRQMFCKVLTNENVSGFVYLFPLPWLQGNGIWLFFSSQTLSHCSAEMQWEKSTWVKVMRTACWVIVFMHARVKLLYHHRLLQCSQNSFMLSQVNLTVYHPLLYRGKYIKIYHGTSRRAKLLYDPIPSVLICNWVNSWVCETWALLLMTTFSSKSVNYTTTLTKQ